MNGQNYVVFHNAADDSYMNSADNFRGAYAKEEAVDIYFSSAGSINSQTAFDKVTVACTNGEEDRAIEQLAAAIGGGRGMTIIADDVNSVYACEDITSVTSITLLGGNKSDVSVVTTAQTLYSYDSGKTIFVNPAATMLIQLPAAASGATTSFGGAGWNVQIVWQEDDGGTMDNIVNIGTASGEFFNGVMTSGDGGGSAIANGTCHDFLTVLAAATSGGSVKIISDGTRMYAAGHCIDGTDAIFATAAAS